MLALPQRLEDGTHSSIARHVAILAVAGSLIGIVFGTSVYGIFASGSIGTDAAVSNGKCPQTGRITVFAAPHGTTTARASATIACAPFGISFTTSDGQTVLREVWGGDAPRQGMRLPTPGASLMINQGTVDSVANIYAPLMFTVGTSNTQAWTVPSWLGNVLANTDLPTGKANFFATEVETVSTEGEGVKLQVATSDPSRKLTVTVEPANRGAITVEAIATPGEDVVAIGDSFQSDAGESFHGFGGRHNRLDQRGNSFYSWAEEENIDAGPVLSPEGTNLFPNGPTAAYYPQAQFISSNSYGFLLNQPELAHFRLASDFDHAWQVDVQGPKLAYTVAPGPPGDTTAILTSITGRHRLPEDWMLGPMLDRLVMPFETPLDVLHDVKGDIRHILHYAGSQRLPLTAYRIEGAAILPPEKLHALIAELHGLGIKVLVYFRAYVGTDAAGTEQACAPLCQFDRTCPYCEALRKHYVATDAAGEDYTFLSPTYGKAALIDFTNPKAAKWWETRIRRVLDLGADGFMQDFGEQVLPDMHFSSGDTGLSFHNAYPVLYHEVTRQIIDRYEKEYPKRQIWFFTRAGYNSASYSGSPPLQGSAAYEGANFPGDETTDWTHSSGIQSVIPDMLNRAVGGAVGFGTDIGGYYDYSGLKKTDKELLLRWAELAALTPIFRLHGSLSGIHTPWTYDGETKRIYLRFSELHLAAVALIQRLWREFNETGMPITRPLWLAYPKDPDAATQDQEWLLGPDVLVAPVVEKDAGFRDVYFPEGCWRDPETGKQYDTPAGRGMFSQVSAPLDKLPYFFHCGQSPPFEPKP